MIYYVEGDITKSECDFICHQVNCKGKMGSGVAKAIREKWPEVYEAYKEKWIDSVWDKSSILGDIQVVALEDNPQQYVVNFFAQNDYGSDGKRYTSYDAFWICLNRLKEIVPKDKRIAFPFKIGCGLGGADWAVIRTMIERVLDDYTLCFYNPSGVFN